jgi:type-F conjugative transfer system pilin assembly protein TrbC
MPICRRSIRSRAFLALVLATGVASNGAAQEAPAARDGARSKISTEGAAAMERLRAAVGARKTDAAARPQIVPAAPAADPRTRRRAFEGVRRQAHDPAMAARAEAAKHKADAAIATERDAMAHRLGQALGLEQPDMASLAKAAAPAAGKHGWVPLLFVSSSMPVTTLRTYAGQLEKVGGVFAFRGMPGGLHKVAPMAKLAAQILRLDPGCEGPACAMRNVQIVVDPIAFRRTGVTHVPALVMVPGDPTQPYCERDDDSDAAAVRPARAVYGDAALSGLLEEYARLGGKNEVRDAQSRLENR